MTLTLTLRTALIIFLLGGTGFYIWRGPEECLWFGVGGALSLLNLAAAAYLIRTGLNSGQKKGFLWAILGMKSITFLGLVGVLLALLKPALLAFTSGVGVVIFGAIGAALWESRILLRRQN